MSKVDRFIEEPETSLLEMNMIDLCELLFDMAKIIKQQQELIELLKTDEEC